MKNFNKYKIFFLISLLPYAFILFYAVFSAISGIGFSFMFSSQTLYGFEGFIWALISGILQGIYIPILPIVFIYQVIYLAVGRKENKKAIRIATIIVIISVIGTLLFAENVHEYIRVLRNNRYEAELEKENTKIRDNVSEMVKNADEIIVYNAGSIYVCGIAGTEFVSSTMFIDYDSKKVAFLFDSIGAEYREFTLSENIIIDNNIVRYKTELNFPGKTLTAFSLNTEERHRIVAIELRMEDGSIYSIDGIQDEYGRLGAFLDLWER